jgi:hypothetical protein
MVYIQRGEVLSTHEVKYTGSWAFSIAPSGRSSLMKYLKSTINNTCHTLVIHMIQEVEIKANWELIDT